MAFSDENISKTLKMALSAACVLVLLYFIYRLRSVLIPFSLACVLAYVLNPTVVFLEKRLRLPRAFSSVLLVLSVVAAIVLILWMIIPAIVDQLYVFNNEIKNYINSSSSQDLFFSAININDLLSYLPDILPKVSGFVAKTFGAVSSVFTLFIIILYTIFLLIDYNELSSKLGHLIPSDYKGQVSGVVRDVRNSMRLYFRSQGSVAMIVGILLAIGFAIIDLPLGIALGLTMGVMNMVPYLQLAGVPFAILLAVSKSLHDHSPMFHEIGLVILVLVVVQIIQEAILNPRIMGRAYSMSPVMILLSISIWSSLLGLLGMIIALPLTALILSYFKYFIANKDYYKNKYKTKANNTEQQDE